MFKKCALGIGGVMVAAFVLSAFWAPFWTLTWMLILLSVLIRSLPDILYFLYINVVMLVGVSIVMSTWWSIRNYVLKLLGRREDRQWIAGLLFVYALYWDIHGRSFLRSVSIVWDKWVIKGSWIARAVVIGVAAKLFILIGVFLGHTFQVSFFGIPFVFHWFYKLPAVVHAYTKRCTLVTVAWIIRKAKAKTVARMVKGFYSIMRWVTPDDFERRVEVQFRVWRFGLTRSIIRLRRKVARRAWKLFFGRLRKRLIHFWYPRGKPKHKPKKNRINDNLQNKQRTALTLSTPAMQSSRLSHLYPHPPPPSSRGIFVWYRKRASPKKCSDVKDWTGTYWLVVSASSVVSPTETTVVESSGSVT